MSDDLTALKLGLASLPQLPPIESLRTAEEFRAATSVLLDRARFFNQAGITFGGARDLYQVLGYRRLLTNRDYRDRYERGGISGRIVDVMPDATWRGTVEVREDKDAKTDTEFEKAWKEIDKRLQVQAKLLRVDKLSRLSNYAVLLIGDRKGQDLGAELERGSGPDDLLYLSAFSGGGGPGGDSRSRAIAMDADCTIAAFDVDAASERFGLPLTYQLKRTDVSSPMLARPVHWSRILHVAENLLDNEVYGQPALERVWNLLDDLDKVTGGGAEAFWLRANAGLHLNVDKDMALPVPAAGQKSELELLKQDLEDYSNQLVRAIRTRGVEVEQLGSDVANFNQPADSILTQIAGAKAIPKRILTGSEMGELASSQDRENFKDQINGRQSSYAGPYILRPLVDRLIKYGFLPEPAKGADVYDVVWPHLQTMTAQEQDARATALATANKTMGEVLYTNDEIRDMAHGKPPLKPEEKVPIAMPVRETAVAGDNPDAAPGGAGIEGQLDAMIGGALKAAGGVGSGVVGHSTGIVRGAPVLGAAGAPFTVSHASASEAKATVSKASAHMQSQGFKVTMRPNGGATFTKGSVVVHASVAPNFGVRFRLGGPVPVARMAEIEGELESEIGEDMEPTLLALEQAIENDDLEEIGRILEVGVDA